MEACELWKWALISLSIGTSSWNQLYFHASLHTLPWIPPLTLTTCVAPCYSVRLTENEYEIKRILNKKYIRYN